MNNEFKVIITVYNAEKYIGKCLDSINNQTYKNWKAIIIDDASTDGTSNIIKEKINLNYIYIRNEINQKALKNYVDYIPKLCSNDEDIIVSIDGDDRLSGDDIFEYLNQIYQDKNIWLTYGQYRNENGNRFGCSYQIADISEARKKGVNFSHLKTFKYKLWKRIKEDDMKYEGKFVDMAWDTAFMPPMIEMAGLDRIKYINKVLYYYNNTNPLSDWRIDEKRQLMIDLYLRAKQPYSKMEQ